ncbi:hypothetical protein G6F68_016822 [Rhizopus microsporus]|nr:hypothetical protein G6F68_016822 [Rhizopus microsporus]
MSPVTDTDQMTGKALELMYDGQFDKAKEMIKEIVDNKGGIPHTTAVTSMMEHAIQRRRFDVSHAIYSTVSGPISTLSPHRRQHAIQMISTHDPLRHHADSRWPWSARSVSIKRQ